MNAMTEAFKYAGVKLSQKERIHAWMKDHPWKTYDEISKALHIHTSSVSSVLSDMQSRGMVKSQRGSRMGRGFTEYAVTMQVYENLPKPAKPSAQPKSLTSADIPMEAQPLVVVPPPKINLEALTIAEARELYHQLKGMFA